MAFSQPFPKLVVPDTNPADSGAGGTGSRQRRRSSAVGEIELGDNAAPSLSTMQATPEAVRASRRRIRALSISRDVVSEHPEGETANHASAVASGVDKKGGAPSSAGSSASLASTASGSEKTTRRVRKPKRISLAKTIWFMYREFAYQNSWFNPLILLLLSGSLYLALTVTNGGRNNFLEPFFTLSYPIAGTDPVQYGKGVKDLYFVFMGMLFFTFFREFVMQVILRPLAVKCGLTKKSKISRFMEQSYSIVYYGMSGPLGLYIMYYSPLWFFETKPFYEGFPHKSHVALFKAYYLLQASFWAQQSVVLSLQLEKPRKDFYELVFHHVVTIALIFLSYRFHFTYMGLAIYITMDISDFFLAFSKTLNYLDSVATGPSLMLFMSTWIYLRHYLNLRVLYSILTEFATVGPYELDWATEQYKCWISQVITFALLFALQLVNAYWLFLILRIVYRFVFLHVAKDDRSDDEDSDDEEENVSTTSESSTDQEKIQ